MNKKLILFLLLVLTKAFILASAYDLFYRSSLEPRLWVYCLFVVIVGFSMVVLQKKKNIVPRQQQIKSFCIVFLLVFIIASLKWGLKTFPLKDVSQVIMTIQMPLDGFTNVFLFDFAKSVLPLCFVSSLFFCKFYAVLTMFFCKKRWMFYLPFVFAILFDVVMFFWYVPFASVVQYFEYAFSSNSKQKEVHSIFWEENYIPAVDSLITRADTSRNLILIFLESIENTFFDYMPELKELAFSNYSFNNNNGIGGGFSVEGADFTMASMVSNTTGIPLLFSGVLTEKISNAQNRSFFSKQKSIYDILQKYGYKNVLLQGSPSKFAGTKSFFSKHGINQIYDPDNLNAAKDIASSYRVASFKPGYTDRTLFQIAKNVLDTLSMNENFTLTMATIDTHYPHGFFDEKCGIPLDSKNDVSVMENALRCLSKNISSFISWLKNQPYAENTEIVLIGDHPFMGSVLVSSVQNEERKFVNVFINPKNEILNTQRTITAFDLYPTILETMGFNVNGAGLGFGRSLLNENKTLIETYGLDSFNIEIKNLSNSIEYQQIF